MRINRIDRHTKWATNFNSRRNVYDWRDVWDVVRLKVPPYRFQRCVPLPKFRIGIKRLYGVWVLMFGWWGLRVGPKAKLYV